MDMSVVQGSVVVAADGSTAAAAALGWGARFAAREGRPLVVVHACGQPGAMDDFEDIVASERGLLSVGRAIAREAVHTARLTDPTLTVDSVVTMGAPADVLLEAAESAAAVVMGARGRGAVASALLGSVSSVVIRQARSPVVVVRRPAATYDAPVVVGVDGTPASTAAVEFAFRRASTEAVPVIVLHATWDLRTRASAILETMSYADRVNLSEEEERLVAETVAGLCERYPDVHVTELYRRGQPVEELVAAARNASLVVVGSRGRPMLTSAILGSVGRGVVERAACPVAVVRPVSAREGAGLSA